MSDIKRLSRAPTHFNFVDCNTLLSNRLARLPVGSFPWQASQNSGISNIFVFKAIQASPLHNSLSEPPCMDTLATCLASGTFLSGERKLHKHFFRFPCRTLPHTWPQQVSLVIEGDSKTPFYFDPKGTTRLICQILLLSETEL